MSSNRVYIVFTRENDQWWKLFLNEINHCYLLTQDKGQWITLGKNYKSVEISTNIAYQDIINDENTVLIHHYDIKQGKRGLFMLNTCVGFIKQYLNINKSFIWTPYQLLKYVSKQT